MFLSNAVGLVVFALTVAGSCHVKSPHLFATSRTTADSADMSKLGGCD